MTKDEIINAAEELFGTLQWHSYRAVPSRHFFGTYNISEKKFDGADICAFYVRYTLDVTFFYRENKHPEDFERETKFENAVRECGEFSCDMSYDSGNDLFYTQYHFDTCEELEE
ncbi:MAG: hypothetical protein NC120_14045 [Ruminococcus sp.]|nr:hypothetical protein [Ruminococcus sp.]